MFVSQLAVHVGLCLSSEQLLLTTEPLKRNHCQLLCSSTLSQPCKSQPKLLSAPSQKPRIQRQAILPLTCHGALDTKNICDATN